jgi:hypothetical protein
MDVCIPSGIVFGDPEEQVHNVLTGPLLWHVRRIAPPLIFHRLLLHDISAFGQGAGGVAVDILVRRLVDVLVPVRLG